MLVLVVVAALGFDFTNGFHDTANAMATSIATGALKPELVDDGGGALLLIVLAGLVGGIVWNVFTWLLGLPSSSSHALFGGLVGSALAGSASRASTGTATAPSSTVWWARW